MRGGFWVWIQIPDSGFHSRCDVLGAGGRVRLITPLKRSLPVGLILQHGVQRIDCRKRLVCNCPGLAPRTLRRNADTRRGLANCISRIAQLSAILVATPGELRITKPETPTVCFRRPADCEDQRGLNADP